MNQSPVSPEAPHAQRVCDVVVVGGGIAGLTAALRAQELGLHVVLIEQGEHERYACNTRFSGGIFHIALHDVKRPPSELLDAVNAATAGDVDEVQARAVVAAAPRLVDWLQEQGARFMRFSQVEWQRWCLAPARPVNSGLDWEGRGPDVTLRRMSERFVALGGVVRLATRAQHLIMAQGACRGVVAEHRGLEQTWRAMNVVLADGGFQSNRMLFEREIARNFDRVFQRGARTGCGDGIRMATEAGAALCMRKEFYGHVLSRDSFVNDRVWPYPHLDEIAIAGIVVNEAGRRVLDEGLGGIAIANQLVRLDVPDTCFVVFDRAIWEGPGRSNRLPANPLLERAEATIHRAGTLAELGRTMDLPAGALEATVDDYNRAVSIGASDRLSPPRTTDKLKAWLLAEPPFMAMPVCAGITYTMGGIAIDRNAQVLSTLGDPVAGLFAAGATTGGLEGGGRVAYIGGLTKSGTLGLLAAERIAALHGTGAR